MPIQVIKEPGPVIDTTTNKPVYFVKEVTRREYVIRESPSPTKVEQDLEPPECWEYKEWERRYVQVETYTMHKLEAKKKTNWTFIAGAILIGVGVVMLTGGAGALIYLAAKGAAVATAAAVSAGVASVAAGIGGIGWGGTLVKNPDDYEPGSLVSSFGPFENEIPPPYPMPPRTERKRIPCPG